MTDSAPYRASWIDHTLDWIDRQPVPAIVVFPGVYALFILVAHVVLWAEAHLPFGAIDTKIVFDMIWVPLGLGYIYFMESAATRSIIEFRPALQVSDAEYADLSYRFTTLPALPTLLLTLAGLAVGIVFSLNTSFAYGGPAESSISFWVWSILSGGGYAFLPVWLYAASRHLLQIDRLYAMVESVNLFNLEPLYGLASVTMIVGGFLVIIGNMNYLWEMFLGTRSQSDATVVGLSVAVILVAVVIFLVPLLGIHRKIDGQKRIWLARNADQIEELRLRLESELSAAKYESVAGIERGLNALFTLRTSIQAVPTWPWSPGTFRNFLTAVALPLLIWTLQRLLAPVF